MIAGQDWAALASLVTSTERQFRRLATAFPFPLSHFRTPNAPAGIDTACRVVAQPREHDDALAKRFERGDDVLRVDLLKTVQFNIVARDAGGPNGVHESSVVGRRFWEANTDETLEDLIDHVIQRSNEGNQKMHAEIETFYDVVVIGGGPTGSTAALELARQKLKVAVFEQTTQFTLRVGESLMPRVFDMLDELGLSESMHNVGHCMKFGAAFGFGHDEELKKIVFTDGFRLGATEAFNVERATFDEMLLTAARDAGAAIFRGCVVNSIEKIEEGAVEIIVDGKRVRASWIIDASGARTIVGRHLGLRKPIPEFRKHAYYAHFTGVKRGEGTTAGDIVIIMCEEGWFWLIPIDEDRTSVGFVVDVAWSKRSGVEPLELLEWAIPRVPQMRNRCEFAKRVSPVAAKADFSYTCKPYAGPGYFLCGDAAIFVDPIFSAGVCLGMESGHRAAKSIVAMRKGEVEPQKARADYMAVFEGVSEIFLRLARLYYGQAFREFIVHPRSTFRINRAMIAILAGHVFPPPLPFHLRWRLRLFEWLVEAQHRIPIVPRRKTFSIAQGEPSLRQRI